MARKQQRTKQKPFDIHAWIEMDNARNDGDLQKAVKIRNTLVEQNRPYAVKVACAFQRSFARACDQQDLIQCACEGLTKAVWRFNPRASKTYKIEDFDPAKGGFTSYSSRYILAEQRKWSRRDRVLFKPLHEDVSRALKDSYKDFTAKHGRPPKDRKEINLPFGTPLAKVARACEPNPSVCSMDEVISSPRCGGANETTQHSIIPDPAHNPEEQMIRREEEFQEILVMADLPRDEYLAVMGYVIEERSYMETGRRIGKSTKETQELVRVGLEKLKEKLEDRR